VSIPLPYRTCTVLFCNVPYYTEVYGKDGLYSILCLVKDIKSINTSDHLAISLAVEADPPSDIK